MKEKMICRGDLFYYEMCIRDRDCKLINLKYEYNGYTGDERWAIITELSVKELWEKYPLVIERYSPFVHLSIAQGEVIDDANRNEDKYAKRSSRTLDCYGCLLYTSCMRISRLIFALKEMVKVVHTSERQAAARVIQCFSLPVC